MASKVRVKMFLKASISI